MENKVSVRIYGQEYNIVGEKSEEDIKEIAAYVDSKMRLINKVSSGGAMGSVAILTSINITEEYFDTLKELEGFEQIKSQLEKDGKYYLSMWEEAKRSLEEYKEQVSQLKTKISELESQDQESKTKWGEFENSFFDLQMENIKLKSELEKLKNK